MTIVNGNSENDLIDHLFNSVQELSELLTQNRSISFSLHASAGAIKTQAAHAQTGFVLRRFNLDKVQDAYDGELERMNASLAAENQTLQHDNKQLGALIREYEQTLESVMSAFRTRARDVQEHELALIREYESKLIARESEDLLRALSASTAQSAALGRISNTLRHLMRVLNGEDAEIADTPSPEVKQGDAEEFDFEEKKDWSLERDSELARLERENSVLRRMLGMEVHEIEADAKWNVTDYGVDNSRLLGPRPGSSKHPPQPPQPQKKILGGAPGTVGPYGTYKKGKSG
ncbi:hypothetical protein DFJ58DRAFT_761035 [Suillus subalutaceus]|uniref:uncharacterized protein n=1 Tax=Suillus subalutaceus TaxID=48586 RepID=UPI001B86B74D|nr:uncharacterized protein DFJ58DRAFT_761035 [Suillus subalutaceus]KAG1872328.1 hypothetical protein DFJ58DRAFT_761035 [Suillus subalutaceus]